MARTTHPGRHRGRRTLATAAAALTLALVGCSGQEDTSGLPPLASATTPTKPTSTGLVLTPEQQAVADAVTRYRKTTDAMSDGMPLDMKKIRQVTSEPLATQIGKNLFQLKALKNRTTGSYKSVILGVKIKGRTAEVTQCIDGRNLKVVTTYAPPSLVGKGGEPAITRIIVIRIGKQWLVKDIKDGGKC